MDTSINDLRSITYMETLKTEGLNTCINVFKSLGVEITDDVKERALTVIEDMVDKFELLKDYKVDSYSCTIDGTDQTDLFVKLSDVEGIFTDFKEKFTTLILQVVLYDLNLFILNKEGEE